MEQPPHPMQLGEDEGDYYRGAFRPGGTRPEPATTEPATTGTER